MKLIKAEDDVLRQPAPLGDDEPEEETEFGDSEDEDSEDEDNEDEDSQCGYEGDDGGN